MKKQELRTRVEEVGLVPVIRTSSAEDARFAVEEVSHAGIPIIELTMTVPGAFDVIRDLVKQVPDVILGAGTVLDVTRRAAALTRAPSSSAAPRSTYPRSTTSRDFPTSS